MNDETALCDLRLFPSEAHEILRYAGEQDVPLRDDPAFCAALVSLDIGRSVPPELFRAVAEVLGFLRGMDAKPSR